MLVRHVFYIARGELEPVVLDKGQQTGEHQLAGGTFPHTMVRSKVERTGGQNRNYELSHKLNIPTVILHFTV